LYFFAFWLRLRCGVARRSNICGSHEETSLPFHSIFWFSLAPAVLIYTVFMIYPLFDSLWLSLNNKSATAGQIFVGIRNYQTLFGQETMSKPFWNALHNNAIFFLIHMLVQNRSGCC